MAAAALAAQRAEHGKERPQERPTSPSSRDPYEPGAQPGEQQGRRLREPHGDDPDESGAGEPASRRPAPGQPESDERQGDRRGHVGRILLDLGAVGDQGGCKSEQCRGEHGGPAPEDAAGKARKERQRRQAAEQRKQAKSQFARPQEGRGALERCQESGRRHLVERERLTEQGSEGSVGHVLGEGDLVDPQGGVREVLPETQGGASEKKKHEHGALPRGFHAAMLADGVSRRRKISCSDA